MEPGVWQDFPANTLLLPEITPVNFPQVEAGLKGSTATDVTGGMLDKVSRVLSIVSQLPGARATIFSGEIPGNVRMSLLGVELGTEIRGI
jgi:isopentenyl phosphate kinase